MGGATSDSPLGGIPLGTRLAYNKVAVALGIARAGIEAFVELAAGKQLRLTTRTLRERPFAQRAVALDDTMWRKVVAGEEFTLRDRALFQIVCSDAVLASAQAVDTVAEAAGTSANQIEQPLERIARNVRVVRQHVTVAPHHIEDGGRVLLGLEPSGLMLSGLRD